MKHIESSVLINLPGAKAPGIYSGREASGATVPDINSGREARGAKAPDISLGREAPVAVEATVIKHSFVERMRGVFHIETVGEGTESFMLTAIGKDIPCHCVFNVLLKTDDRHARLIVDGGVEISTTAKMVYTLGVLALLVLGLFHGTINTSGSGNATDFMVFLFLGIFIFYDMDKKLSEPGLQMDRILRAVATEFGD